MFLPTIDSESFPFYSSISNHINLPGRSDDEVHINEDDHMYMELSDPKSSSTSSLSESEDDESVEHSGHCDPSQQSETLTLGDSPQNQRGEQSEVQPCGNSSGSSESVLHPVVSLGDF